MVVLFSTLILPNMVAGKEYVDFVDQGDALEWDFSQVKEILEEEKFHQPTDLDSEDFTPIRWGIIHQELFDNYIQRCQTPPPDCV